MSRRRVSDFDVEPERYELGESPAYRFDLGRREFLRAAGGGLVVLLLVRGEASGSPGPEMQGRGQGPEGPREIGAWLHVGEDGVVTAFTGKAEVGQDIRTSLTQAVAEELRAPLDSIRIVMADTESTPYDRGTFGSRTTPTMSLQLRRAAAAAREHLLDAAADAWGVAREAVSLESGRIVHAASGNSSSFRDLTRGERWTKAIEADVATAPPSEWKTLGRSVPKVNGEAIVTGRHRYASDVRRPGMLFGKVLRPPSIGAERAELDVSAARAMEGVTVVVDGDFVGVAAPSRAEAERALAAIRAEWKAGQGIAHAELFAHLKENPTEGRGRRGPSVTGSIEEGLRAADETLSASYTVAYVAHAPLETRAAVAEWEKGRLTVWTGTQRPFGVREELAEAFRLDEAAVRVIVPDTGSGYGGKHTGEAAVEAARLAKAAGKPVQIAWTREEEFTWAYFRPAGLIEIRSGVTREGTITAWEFHNYNSGSSGIEVLYEVPHQHLEFHPTDSPLRQGSYRALAATANHFARESHVDELAHAVGMDPLAFRLRNLRNARLQDVLEAAASRFGWAERGTAPGRGAGLAVGFEKGGYVASCAEISVDERDGAVRVARVVTAFDCGAIVHPRNLESQVEGAVIMGLGGALFEAIRFAGGEILNPRFSQYRVPRFLDVPRLETVLLDRKGEPPAGAGETPIVAVAPAIGNAIFAATGKRHRSLPMI